MLFRKKIDRYCTYCQFAGKIDDETMVLVADHDRRVHAFEHQPLQGLLEQRLLAGQGQELFWELLTGKRPKT